MKQIVSLLLFFTSLCHAQVTFEQTFAPHDGLVKYPEANFRQEVCLNGLWDFQGMALPQDWQRNTGQSKIIEFGFKTSQKGDVQIAVVGKYSQVVKVIEVQ